MVEKKQTVKKGRAEEVPRKEKTRNLNFDTKKSMLGTSR